jgi:hypothetical protein
MHEPVEKEKGLSHTLKGTMADMFRLLFAALFLIHVNEYVARTEINLPMSPDPMSLSPHVARVNDRTLATGCALLGCKMCEEIVVIDE